MSAILRDIQIYAASELLPAPPWREGICFLPECSQPFTPARSWQMYCCTACERAGTAEMRKWGHRMALPLLTWRIGKYEQQDTGIREFTRAVRRYVSRAQSAWLADRNCRSKKAEAV
ncbi:MAG: hypothetical protein ACPGNV_14185 [Mangrovicoccus sp.]